MESIILKQLLGNLTRLTFLHRDARIANSSYPKMRSLVLRRYIFATRKFTSPNEI